ncbi:Phosphohistidine phosphatase SixA [Botrimarina colliarenosi]|uniref:Phosphohistidine phosphatase SixA n=1 Tax=Botrimarina colliarenosi TaxID=2528001 RepID=A0A5C6AKC7_9BACT|nr:histidine phosphatase family protein [Botrimarina colliarenosi]TWT99886.1 Phosphohistidine phosphatase SixA [Botrimarina colliarenosi]
MIVYLARHAWAGHYGDPAWPDDSQRPLTDEGIERYRRMVERLVEGGFAPERIATSPYVRCVQTAELLAEATGAPIESFAELAPGATSIPLLRWCEIASSERVCLVGHNPDLESISASWLGDDDASIRFAKGAVAAVRFDVPPPEPGDGTLLWHATAKLLGV